MTKAMAAENGGVAACYWDTSEMAEQPDAPEARA